MTGPQRHELHVAIRDNRTRYQAAGEMPDWKALEALLRAPLNADPSGGRRLNWRMRLFCPPSVIPLPRPENRHKKGLHFSPMWF